MAPPTKLSLNLNLAGVDPVAGSTAFAFESAASPEPPADTAATTPAVLVIPAADVLVTSLPPVAEVVDTAVLLSSLSSITSQPDGKLTSNTVP